MEMMKEEGIEGMCNGEEQNNVASEQCQNMFQFHREHLEHNSRLSIPHVIYA